ncbi:RNA polymerase-binding protein DksA [Blochmannia endosymbiont of Colobopsis nipponica]|uniref:RNA polymerase-binding protein DksA n=1 Tax=Blochmannia endosymbiont of Colobopsis nipponica TaxID=2681987 RepID=UPI00177FB116|nr:RNA polymerase-binding protein DksA [Blochmannia endosymbiont of Colobopsis nipponica]QOI11254.1 RNA polymerase-binding protein DksA [Blochmannia endosymbiont of Colobopsis nipponica]
MQKQTKRKISSLSILSMAGVNPYEEKQNEKYMNDAQLIHFTRILKAWHNQLENEIKRTTSNMQSKATNFPDPIDRAAQEEEFNLVLRHRARERKLIKKIESTLHKIKEKKFGFCESCDIKIGIRRLEARPTTNLCIDCKTLAEIRKNK